MHNILTQWIEEKKKAEENPNDDPYYSISDSMVYNQALTDLLADLPQVLPRIEQELVTLVGEDENTGKYRKTSQNWVHTMARNLEKKSLRSLIHSYCNKE